MAGTVGRGVLCEGEGDRLVEGEVKKLKVDWDGYVAI
jgi:hypothetical protein